MTEREIETGEGKGDRDGEREGGREEGGGGKEKERFSKITNYISYQKFPG